MNERDSWREFAKHGAEAALNEVIRRYLPLVYSVALRQTNHDTLLAQEVAQETFCIFARKARTLSADVPISNWLARTAFHLGQKAARGEARRRIREKESFAMQQCANSSDDETIWEQISPDIDEALQSLPEADQWALNLRFFERKRMRELAEDLGISEEAARMRVSRALGRLRNLLVQRGITVSVSTLGVMILERGSAALPAELLEQVQSRAASSVMQGANRGVRFGAGRATQWVTTSAVVGLLLMTPLLLSRSKSRSGGDSGDATPVALAAGTTVRASSSASGFASFDLQSAAAALRKALRDPWNSRIPPFERVDEALAAFGKHRRAAAPVLMEMLLGERKNHTYESKTLAAHGLMQLGPDAVETLDDLVILHRSGDLGFLDERQVELFSAIDISGLTIPSFMEDIQKPSEPTTVSILARLLRNNPGIAPMYKETFADLLRSRAHRRTAALVMAHVPELYEPPVKQELLAVIERARSVDWQARGYRITDDDEVKPWIVPAIRALAVLRAKEGIEPLLELARTAYLPEATREAAFSALTDICGDSVPVPDELAEWRLEHERAQLLARKAERNEASFEELVAGLGLNGSAGAAARRLSENKTDVTRVLPALLKAAESFADPDAIATLGLAPVPGLIRQLESKNTDGVQYVARVLGAAKSREAVPLLQEIVEVLDQHKPSTESAVREIEMALNQIEGRYQFVCLESFMIPELNNILSDLSKNAEWAGRLAPSRSYLRDKVYVRRSVFEELLTAALRDDDDLRNAFLAHNRTVALLPFLRMNEFPSSPSAEAR